MVAFLSAVCYDKTLKGYNYEKTRLYFDWMHTFDSSSVCGIFLADRKKGTGGSCHRRRRSVWYVFTGKGSDDRDSGWESSSYSEWAGEDGVGRLSGSALRTSEGIALLSDIIVTTSAIVKFNQYLERLKHITDELHAISNQIGAELYQNVMHVLDMQESSRQKLDDVKLEVSEEIRMQIVELKTRAQNLGEKVPKPARRLLKAFPKLESRNYKAQLELFRQKLEQHLGRH